MDTAGGTPPLEQEVVPHLEHRLPAVRTEIGTP